jgi:hypothetical protein
MKKLALAVIVLFALLLTDLTSRFMGSAQPTMSNFNANSGSVKALPLLSKTAHMQLTQLYKQLAEPEKKDITEQVIREEGQGEQEGELLSLFSGDLELRLKAVIFANVPYALIEQKNTKTQNTTLVKYSNGQNIEGFTLTILSNTQVALSKAQQHITLIMYQSG